MAEYSFETEELDHISQIAAVMSAEFPEMEYLSAEVIIRYAEDEGQVAKLVRLQGGMVYVDFH